MHSIKKINRSMFHSFLCKAMSQNDETGETEPIMRICKICDVEEEIEYMVDCPLYSEDIGKGIIPGWIHTECCEQDFNSEPEQCMEHCDNENLPRNIIKHFESCVNVKGLSKTEMRDVPAYMSEDRIFAVTSQMDKFLESFKPLNMVTDIFLDKEMGQVFARDNQRHINVYSLTSYNEIEERFSSFWPFSPEEFCTKDGPLFLVYRIGNAVVGASIAPRIPEEDINDVGIGVATTYRERYLKAEEFFGVAVKPCKEELKSMIQELSEDELINVVLCPLLSSLGFKGVNPISFHGPGESGGDFHPFYKTNEFGKILYYSAQAKAVRIHSKAGIKEGNVNQLIDQIKKLFRTPFKSFIDNTEKRITLVFIFSSQDITSEARDQLFHEFENRQAITFVDVEEILNSILEQGIAEQVFEYFRKRKIRRKMLIKCAR